MSDEETLQVYDQSAQEYANKFNSSEPDFHLARFIAALPPGADVLDLGCGPASASAHMRAAGLRPDPVDASESMVALANEHHDIGARLARFDDITASAAYDGIWANFSLLHAPRADMPGHLAALHRALRPEGLLHLGMKLGESAGRDRLGRYYTYYSETALAQLVADAGFTITQTDKGESTGLAGPPEPWIIIFAHG
ncbi:MAG: class I SAM-dependent methyltransferase [Rhodobacteraceae bacterium]|nr:class I SAM-dependent methyltransferase [Paracoccaceae bacterium]